MDARTVLLAAAKNIGADTLKTIQISGTGYKAATGQSYSPAEDWPKYEVTSYTKTIDFDAMFSREQLTRRQEPDGRHVEPGLPIPSVGTCSTRQDLRGMVLTRILVV